MEKRIHRFFQVSILDTLAIFIGAVLSSGRLSYYINLRFKPLIILGEGFLILFIMVLTLEPILQYVDSGVRAKSREIRITQVLLPFLALLPVALSLFSVPDILLVIVFLTCFLVRFRLCLFGDLDEDVTMVDISNGRILSLVVLLAPFILGFFVAPRPLESSMIQTKGIAVTSSRSISGVTFKPLEMQSAKMDILDWLQYFYSLNDPSDLAGEQISLTGFVYQDSQLGESRFMLSRFVITCCAADAYAVGIPVEWTGTSGLSNDEWVAVRGTISVTGSSENRLLEIHADSVDSISQPNQPYIFP